MSRAREFIWKLCNLMELNTLNIVFVKSLMGFFLKIFCFLCIFLRSSLEIWHLYQLLHQLWTEIESSRFSPTKLLHTKTGSLPLRWVFLPFKSRRKIFQNQCFHFIMKQDFWYHMVTLKVNIEYHWLWISVSCVLEGAKNVKHILNPSKSN